MPQKMLKDIVPSFRWKWRTFSRKKNNNKNLILLWTWETLPLNCWWIAFTQRSVYCGFWEKDSGPCVLCEGTLPPTHPYRDLSVWCLVVPGWWPSPLVFLLTCVDTPAFDVEVGSSLWWAVSLSGSVFIPSQRNTTTEDTQYM